MGFIIGQVEKPPFDTPFTAVTCDECNSVIGVYGKGESYTVDAIEHNRTEHAPPPARPIEEIRADIQEFLRNNP